MPKTVVFIPSKQTGMSPRCHGLLFSIQALSDSEPMDPPVDREQKSHLRYRHERNDATF